MPSRGCGTCVDRKVLCDRTLPKCRRCATSGRACKGYDLRLSWPRAGDKKRALLGPDTPATVPFSNFAELPFINASSWDIEMHYDGSLPESLYKHALARRGSQITRLHRMRQLARPVVGTALSWMPPNISAPDKDLLQYFISVASFSLPTFSPDAAMIRQAIIRMALAGSTPSTTAVLKAALALASLYRGGPRNRAAQLKISALRALSASAYTNIGSAECIQHVAAGMLLCTFEVQQTSKTSSHWLWYICGSKDIIKTAKLEDSAHNSDFTALIGWVHYYDVAGRFSLRHWQRHHSIESITNNDDQFHDFSPTVCARSRAANLIGTSHVVLDLLSEICDSILDPSDSKYHSDEYRQYLKVLEWRVRRISINDQESASNASEMNVTQANKLYQLAALTYINRASQNSAGQSEKVLEWVKEAFLILSRINTCKAPLPLFVFGCEASSDEMRAIILNLISATERVSHMQSLEQVKSMLEFIWVQNDIADIRMDYTDQISRIFGSSEVLPAMV
ncbi:fungal-specific transcription factor domain-containing protein [Dactylonectria macrodidyma]|uniref:Fungal-specific transcription factor domain-containing protein n=1 Tax=Dactylonectria macrodidyma TaxID=307937 RepID=A0A9P9EPE0_9HYPO|nr:fungal-specific transcription factor domain-containing protein [Dactylonectria macrodidyma]